MKKNKAYKLPEKFEPLMNIRCIECGSLIVLGFYPNPKREPCEWAENPENCAPYYASKKYASVNE